MTFVYESLRDAGDIILDFELNKDKIDLSAVLSSIGYQGDSPLADGYVSFTGYDGGTVVNLDSDGTGGRESRAYIRVQGVTPEELASNPNHICPHPEVATNQPPIADPDKFLAVPDDGSVTLLNINPPSDPDGDTLTITVEDLPAADKGTVRLGDETPVQVGQVLTISELEGLQFIPVAGETGAAGSFIYTVDDGQGGTDSQTITFNITPVIVLLEGSSFRVSESQEIIIPNESSVLSFTYDSLSFDPTK